MSVSEKKPPIIEKKLPNQFYSDIADILKKMIDCDIMFFNSGYFHYKSKKYEINIDIKELIRNVKKE